jgi:hypothetical protein
MQLLSAAACRCVPGAEGVPAGFQEPTRSDTVWACPVAQVRPISVRPSVVQPGSPTRNRIRVAGAAAVQRVQVLAMLCDPTKYSGHWIEYGIV